jgi:hypothetical protein
MCTNDSCDPYSGDCDFASNIDCNDNNECTSEGCNPTDGQCVSVNKVCDDGKDCTDDTCDIYTGECVFKPQSCSDNDECTADSCNLETGNCQHKEKDCNDGVSCTDDTCDSSTGTCSNTSNDKYCTATNPCSVAKCDQVKGCVENPIDCSDQWACTKDYCLNGVCYNDKLDSACSSSDKCQQGQCTLGSSPSGCTFTPITCNDGFSCTLDKCDSAIGCVYTPNDLACSPLNNCFTACCDPKLGCVNTPKDCNDNNPCTSDTCVNGKCQNNDANFCNDGLRCTDDICKPDPLDSTKHVCQYSPDLNNCGIVPSCKILDCGYYRDCTLKLYNDSACAPHTQAPACMKPQCTDNGCFFKDICGATHPDCNGCADCACVLDLNKCIRSCPSKRSLENELTEDPFNGGYLLSVGITNLFFFLCLIYMINKL